MVELQDNHRQSGTGKAVSGYIRHPVYLAVKVPASLTGGLLSIIKRADTCNCGMRKNRVRVEDEVAIVTGGAWVIGGEITGPLARKQ